MPKVTIIILNWNGWQDTIECLESLNKIDYDNFEVAIVDNGSTDDSAVKLKEFIKSFNFKFSAQGGSAPGGQVSALQMVPQKVTILNFQENKGFAGGVNAIIKNIYNTDYFLLLNNDTIVAPDFLKKMVSVAENDKKIGIIGPMIYFHGGLTSVTTEVKPPCGMHINSAGSKVNWLMNKGGYMGYNEKDDEQFGNDPYEVDYISGACLLIKKKVVDKIGLLPEEYFLYYEDTEWNFRAKKVGYKSILVPTAKIWHKESASAKKIGAKYVYYHVRNGILFNRRCAPFYKKILIHFYNLYIFAKQMVKLSIPSKREWAKATISGIVDYYRGHAGELKNKI